MRVAYMGKCMGQITDYSYRLHSLTHCQVHSFIASFLTVSRQLSSPLAGFSYADCRRDHLHRPSPTPGIRNLADYSLTIGTDELPVD